MLIPLPKVVANITFFPASRVYASRGWTTIVRQDMKTLLQQDVNGEIVKTGAPNRNNGFLYNDTYEKEVADEGVGGCCLERRSFVAR